MLYEKPKILVFTDDELFKYMKAMASSCYSGHSISDAYCYKGHSDTGRSCTYGHYYG